VVDGSCKWSQPDSLPLRLQRRFEKSIEVGELFDLAREHGSFCDVLDALAGRHMPAAEEAPAIVRGDLFASDLFGALRLTPSLALGAAPAGVLRRCAS
jgi:hypothetical protein